MAGLFENIGEFFTGDKQKSAEAQQKKAGKLGGAAAKAGNLDIASAVAALTGQGEQANQLAQGYNQGAVDSMGANAADYMQRANVAAQGQAGQEAQQAATAGARNALGAMRTGGINRGQAALAAGQQAGDTYTSALQQGLQNARNQYGQATAQFAGQGAQQQQLAQNAAGTVGNLGTNRLNTGLNVQAGTAAQRAQQSQGDQAKGGGMLQGAADFLFSDERLKTNVKDASIDGILAKLKAKPESARTALEDATAKVRPVSFNYKPESGQDTSKTHQGAMAQDLEKTDMKDNVVDTPAGKMVDTAQQTMSNTNLIIQLAQKMFEQEAELKKLRGGQ